MIDVVTVCSDLNMENLHAERCQRSNERFQDSTLGRQPKFDEGERTIRTVHESDQRLRNTQHECAPKHAPCQR